MVVGKCLLFCAKASTRGGVRGESKMSTTHTSFLSLSRCLDSPSCTHASDGMTGALFLLIWMNLFDFSRELTTLMFYTNRDAHFG